MPAFARKQVVRKGQPGIFHCWNRCARQLWLLGKDPSSESDYSYRRGWIADRLRLQTQCFCIDIGFEAILSNHFHLVLRTDPRLAEDLSDREVARRWLRVYPGKWVLDGNWIEPSKKQVDTLVRDKARIRVLRRRLSSISWFMASLSEYIARRANREQGTKGRFWSGRFGCRECINEASLLICGMYVDLNQIRAGEAISPETSEHSSVWWRIQAEKELVLRSPEGEVTKARLDDWLAPLTLQPDHLGSVPSKTGSRASDKGLLSMSLSNYLRLLDYAGRTKRADKSGAIPADLLPVLERLGLRAEDLRETVTNFPSLFRRIAGTTKQMIERAKEAGIQWFQGVRAAARIFAEDAELG